MWQNYSVASRLANWRIASSFSANPNQYIGCQKLKFSLALKLNKTYICIKKNFCKPFKYNYKILKLLQGVFVIAFTHIQGHTTSSLTCESGAWWLNGRGDGILFILWNTGILHCNGNAEWYSYDKEKIEKYWKILRLNSVLKTSCE